MVFGSVYSSVRVLSLGEVGLLEALRSVCGHLGASALPSICSSLDEEKFGGSKGDFPVKAQEGGRKVHGDMKMYR